MKLTRKLSQKEVDDLLNEHLRLIARDAESRGIYIPGNTALAFLLARIARLEAEDKMQDGVIDSLAEVLGDLIDDLNEVPQLPPGEIH